MHSTHIILVNLHDDIEEVESSNELRKYAIMKAENETDRFFGHVFDSRRLLKEGEDGDFPVPVVLSQGPCQSICRYREASLLSIAARVWRIKSLRIGRLTVLTFFLLRE